MRSASLGDVLPAWIRVAACLALICAVAACSSNSGRHAASHYSPSRYYPPPGPASDPWGPYIHEASARFGVPETWIRRVMRQESGGQEDVVSWAGAMGLMQVMPDTYDGLRQRYGLGSDPFDPHNNILAGAAYLREMYDRFGSPGFLAAYNAGPNRLDAYLKYGNPLPAETVNYVASIAPLLGSEMPMSGPLAVYASGGPRVIPVASRGFAGGCDPDAAYDPNRPCAPLHQPVIVAAIAPVVAAPIGAGCDPDAAFNPDGPCTPVRPTEVAMAPSYNPPPVYTSPVGPPPANPAYGAVPASAGQGGCDPDAAYNPGGPCSQAPPSRPSPPVVVAAAAPVYALPPCDPDAAYNPHGSCRWAPAGTTFASRVRALTLPPVQTASFTPGQWAIQVGAFANLPTAMAAAETARSALPDMLQRAKIELPPTTPFGTKVVYRARLAGLTPDAAADACARLSARGLPCITVPPGRDAF